MKTKYVYDGKKVAAGVWILIMVYAFGTLPQGGITKGWLHLILYGGIGAAVLLLILAMIREKEPKN